MNNIFKYNWKLTIAFSLLGSGLYAQQVPDPVNNTPAAPPGAPVPVAYPSVSDFVNQPGHNYIMTIIPDVPVPEIDQYSVVVPARRTTDYFDGLGRPLQTVKKNAHADGNDIVNVHVYDAMGRENIQYLPYAKNVGLSFGGISLTPKSDLEQFYDPANGEPPYGKTEYDNSPLNRVTKQMAPGKSWVGSNRGVQFEYRGNLAAEGVRIFTIGNDIADIPQSSAAYAANLLSVTKTTDEDGKYTLEYKDRFDHLVLKKNYLSGSSQAHDGFACTYYVYDELQRLRYIIPPEAVAQRTEAGNTWTFSAAVANGLCYKYFYDDLGRAIEKKIPGKEPEYFVYDKRDNQVLYQDGNLRAQGKWSYTIYDALNRPLCTGLYTSALSRATLQAQVYDNITYAPGHINTALKNYGLYHFYPTGFTDCQMLTYQYYDDYNELGNHAFYPDQFNNITPPPDGTTVASVLSSVTAGLPTGSKVRVMDPDNPGASNWLTTANYYDDNGRLIQSQSQNIKGGLDISSNIYYFQGMLWKNVMRHQNPASQMVPGVTDAILNEIFVTKTFERNLAVDGGSDQVYRVTQKIGNGITYDLAYYGYDHLGRTTVKQFTAANILQEYNIRGWLNHIQAANFNNDPGTTQLEPHIFEEKLFYDNGFESKLYNGNIAGITWKKAGTLAPVEAYGYSYDNLNRLKHAEYRRQNTGTTSWLKNEYDYTASNINYDLNGNIQTMNQEVPTMQPGVAPIHMDQLAYSYAPNSNKLIKVEDAVAASVTTPMQLPDFKDNNHTAEEYLYDNNGNLTTDKNKNISSITYNYLNKPEKITVTGQGIITYVYDAAGNRLQKKILNTANNSTEVYDYIGNFVYKQNVLQYILNEEGRTRPIPIAIVGQQGEFTTKFVYDYFVKDHLGNVRSTVTAKPLDGVYLARHEVASANIEQLIFDNIPNVRENKPGSTAINDAMAARLEGSDPNRRVGTAIMLQTMPGDRFNISVDAYYDGTFHQEENSGTEDVISSLMGALMGGANYDGIPVSELPDNVRTVTTTLNNPQLVGQLDNLINSNNNPDAPKAHLNYLFFNDKMELIPGNSGVIQVPVSPMGWIAVNPSVGNLANAINGTVGTTEPGWVIIYIDNQSIGKDVWFDNLMVGLYKGEVIEENHYYPFGLTLATAETPNVTKNPLKYNGKELEKSFDLETYEYGARQYDPQIGRWKGVDELANKYYDCSPFAYVLNRPTVAVDPDGKRVYFVAGAGNDPKEQGWNYVSRFANIWQKAGIEDFRRVNASHGKAGDMLFVDTYRDGDQNSYSNPDIAVQNSDRMLKKAVDGIKNDLKNQPLEEGDQMNMVGYSYGSVLQEYATIELVKQGIKVDNLILIGSPTKDGSLLMKTLQGYEKEGRIGSITRIDIPGDKLSNPKSDLEYLKGILQGATEGDKAHHFDLARPGAEADNNIKKAAEMLRGRGVK